MSETEVTTQVTETPEVPSVDNNAPPAEVKPEEVKKEPAIEDRQTAKLMEMARKEARFLREQRDFANQKAQYEAEKAKYEQAIKFMQDFESNPYAVIKQKNINFDSILDAHLGNVPEKAPVDDRPEWAKRIEQRFEDFDKSQKQAEEAKQRASYEQALNSHLQEVGQFVSKNSDKYEGILLHSNKAQEVYLDIYRSATKELGRSLDEEEIIACIDRTEELITEEIRPLLEKAYKSKKFAFSQPAKIEPEIKKTEDKKVKTLTNSLAATAPTTPNKPDPSKSLLEQRMAEVIARRKSL